jgi:UDP-glucose 4-epimerase
LRYFNAAGGDPDREVKNYKKKETNLIPIVLKSLKKGDGSMTIFGTDYDTPDGTCVRDYIHVYDLGDAHITAMQQLFDGGPSTIYNLGNGQGFTVKQVLQTIEKITKRKINIVEGPRRQGDPPILRADAKKAQTLLNWNPQYPELEIIIEHAWNAL